METHPPAEKIDIAEEKEKDVEAALEHRKKMFQEQMCRFEKDEVAASFNEAFIDYSAWAERVSDLICQFFVLGVAQRFYFPFLLYLIRSRKLGRMRQTIWITSTLWKSDLKK
jgi:hypothetical protein